MDYVIRDLKGEGIAGKFYEKEFQKTNQAEFMIEEVIKRKGGKVYVKWKGYNSSFNSWIDKKRYCYIKMSYFPPYSYSKNKIQVELDLFNYDLRKQQVLIHHNLLKKMIYLT